MKRILTTLMLLIIILSFGIPTSVFAEEMSSKTEVGINFTAPDNVPNANQVLPLINPRGQPLEKIILPKTNEKIDSSLSWEGLVLLFLFGIFVVKIKKKEEENNE